MAPGEGGAFGRWQSSHRVAQPFADAHGVGAPGLGVGFGCYSVTRFSGLLGEFS